MPGGPKLTNRSNGSNSKTKQQIKFVTLRSSNIAMEYIHVQLEIYLQRVDFPMSC